MIKISNVVKDILTGRRDASSAPIIEENGEVYLKADSFRFLRIGEDQFQLKLLHNSQEVREFDPVSIFVGCTLTVQGLEVRLKLRIE